MRKVRWTMPKWMEQYRHYIPDYGLGVEEMMNRVEAKAATNIYRFGVSIGVVEAVALLTRLHKMNVLKAAPPSERETPGGGGE